LYSFASSELEVRGRKGTPGNQKAKPKSGAIGPAVVPSSLVTREAINHINNCRIWMDPASSAFHDQDLIIYGFRGARKGQGTL
jgi:hypothetical protein